MFTFALTAPVFTFVPMEHRIMFVLLWAKQALFPKPSELQRYPPRDRLRLG
jgi:hypothetical protein